MKVVGLDGQGNFLCSVSVHELRRITQFDPPARYSGNDASTDHCGRNTWIGQELDIAPAWDRLHVLKSNRKQLDSAIRQLRACADILEPIAPLVDCETQECTNEAAENTTEGR